MGVGESVVEMRDTGHLPMDERPEEMARVLLSFIRGGGSYPEPEAAGVVEV